LRPPSICHHALRAHVRWEMHLVFLSVQLAAAFDLSYIRSLFATGHPRKVVIMPFFLHCGYTLISVAREAYI
jgi:hypothetical protein